MSGLPKRRCVKVAVLLGTLSMPCKHVHGSCAFSGNHLGRMSSPCTRHPVGGSLSGKTPVTGCLLTPAKRQPHTRS